VHLSRSWILWDAACHERLVIGNYGDAPVRVRLSVEFENDFADIFEVRGFQRERRGEALAPTVGPNSVELGYRGLDGAVRRTRIQWSVDPVLIQADRADFDIEIGARAKVEVETTIACALEGAAFPRTAYAVACRAADTALQDVRDEQARVASPNDQFNAWLHRSAADLTMLTAGNPERGYPYAGVPWYSVPFGRDGILTAMQYLWVNPGMAQGVLRFLAETQATERDPARDAEPGKIVHEMRKGELAALGEIPFGRYYGTIDATPLFRRARGRIPPAHRRHRAPPPDLAGDRTRARMDRRLRRHRR
jgi:glycogen debranching enzyme